MKAVGEDGPWQNIGVGLVPQGLENCLQDNFPPSFSGDTAQRPRGGGINAAVPLPQSLVAPVVAQKVVQAAVRKGELHLRAQ